MIKIDKDYDNVPSKLTRQTVENRIVMGDFTQGYYGEEEVRDELNNLYNNKCGFCEAKRKSATLQIEHFRPRNYRKNNTHTGYPWLSYEWSNLLLACSHCNSKKSSWFPISSSNKRVANQPSDRKDWRADAKIMLDEEALLLNPELDEPSEHLEVSPEDYEIKGITEKGKKSIEVYDLNREILHLEWRKKAIDDIFGAMEIDVKALYELIEENKIPKKLKNRVFQVFNKYFDKINKNSNIEEEFSLVFKTFYDKFDEFLEKQGKASFEQKHKEFLKKAFKQYQESH